MQRYNVVYGSSAEDTLTQDYVSILNCASSELSESEYRHLSDIANVGYEHATEKDDYIVALQDTITDWIAETRRTTLHLVDGSMEIDFGKWYNEPVEVKKQMQSSKGLNVIPAFFVYFGAIVLTLFCISATIFMLGFAQGFFFINPVYLFMFTVGFLGLLLTDIVAITEWRKCQRV